jgi:misacylated tRNA(Ala) deacylase
MTEMLYQTDAYLKEFAALVTAVDAETRSVLLDRTAFYPGGGGQPFDSGELEIGGMLYRVARPRKTPEGIWHILEGEGPLPDVGTAAVGRLNWERRYQLMRTHTAMHILCGTIFRDFGAHVTGGDMDPLKGRMDFEFESLHKDLVQVIEDAVNREVAAAHPVRTAILPREQAFAIPDLIRTKISLLPVDIKEVRIVEITGLDLQADGGTHVINTREVGRMHIPEYKSKGKINKRIYVELE